MRTRASVPEQSPPLFRQSTIVDREVKSAGTGRADTAGRKAVTGGRDERIAILAQQSGASREEGEADEGNQAAEQIEPL